MVNYDLYTNWLQRLIALLETKQAMESSADRIAFIDEMRRDTLGLVRFCKLAPDRPQTDDRIIDFLCRMSRLQHKTDELLEQWDAG